MEPELKEALEKCQSKEPIPVAVDPGKTDSVATTQCKGTPVYYTRWKDGVSVAYAIVCCYMDLTCPKCYGHMFKKSNKPGLLECTGCKEKVILEKQGKKRVELVHINVRPEHRGKGYGKDLIEAMKIQADRIVTSWDDSTEEGRGLCLSAGLIQYGKIMVWGKNETFIQKEK